MPLFEGDCTPRLKYPAELPPGKVAAHFDRIDRTKSEEVCGDAMCFWGNMPSSMLATRTPPQVKHDVKGIVCIMGDGLILDGLGGLSAEAKPENILALREALDEYCAD